MILALLFFIFLEIWGLIHQARGQLTYVGIKQRCNQVHGLKKYLTVNLVQKPDYSTNIVLFFLSELLI